MPLFLCMYPYSIIIPVFNEKPNITLLLKSLEIYYKQGHEIIIIDDGSNDGSGTLLENNNFIKLEKFKSNKGKGCAVIKGLRSASNERIIIFDGDLELKPNEISSLMELDKRREIKCIFGARYKKKFFPLSFWELGNYLFTNLFNIKYMSNLDDALCCAKSFYKDDLNIDSLNSKKFGIDIEIASQLVNKFGKVKNIPLKYSRRTKVEGKKIRFRDAISIFKIIFNN